MLDAGRTGPVLALIEAAVHGVPAAEAHAERALTGNARRPIYVTAEPWPGTPIRKGNRTTRAVDVADGTWPDLAGKFRPHDERHTHATWLDAADLHKVIQMDRRGHTMPGMDAVCNHITLAMRQRPPVPCGGPSPRATTSSPVRAMDAPSRALAGGFTHSE